MTWTSTDDVDVFPDTAGAPPAVRPSTGAPRLTVPASLRQGGRPARGEGMPDRGRGTDGEATGAARVARREVLSRTGLAHPTGDGACRCVGRGADPDRSPAGVVVV
ncbi:hypothetical protein [Streptomyces clavifer]|uniref:hypothetical protein n=1 Tax=Streptomyces clavifer TaxID=68188 RepID=UPI0037240270